MEKPRPKRVLLVDDDPIVLQIYRDGLTRQGFEVKTGSDGLTALQALRAAVPDVVVLDLMMPKFSGVEVLKFIRGQKGLETLPVIVLSNAYMDPLAQDAAALGAQKGLLKVKCNPVFLALAINEVLAGPPVAQSVDHLLAVSKTTPPDAPAPTLAPTATEPEVRATISTPLSSEPEQPPSSPKDQARRELLGNAPNISSNLGRLFEAFRSARANEGSDLRLQDFYRQVHFLAAIAGIAESSAIAQMASALEALLFKLMEQLPRLESSVEHTTSAAVNFLQDLLEKPPQRGPSSPRQPLVLVVDDDRVSNRLVISALHNAQLQARGTESPEIALQWLREKQYELVLLDVEMPGMDGIELCGRLRGLPGYETTPVIYVTLHSDFETRAKTVLSGGDDLIAKPILPTELAVKAVMHLLKSQLKR